MGVDVQSSIKSTKLHRLLRRGRPYLERTESEATSNGIFFIACNADLERQFEFIHQRWVRNPRFGCLHDQDDPIVGAPVSPKTFSVPGVASGEVISLDAFTQTLGGGYFFLPGLKALAVYRGHSTQPSLGDQPCLGNRSWPPEPRMLALLSDIQAPRGDADDDCQTERRADERVVRPRC